MSRKTRKLIWSAPLVAVLAVAGALAIFVTQAPNEASAQQMDPPGMVQNVQVTAYADGVPEEQLELTWEAPTSGGSVDSYRIDISMDGDRWMSYVPNHRDSELRLVYSGLESEQMRHFRVFAVNRYGTGPGSDDSGTTDMSAKPDRVDVLSADAPSDTTAAIDLNGDGDTLDTVDGVDEATVPTPSQTTIVLTWEAPDESPPGASITGYEIQYREDRQTSWNDLASVSATTMMYYHRGLLANTKMHYRIFAKNKYGLSTRSDGTDATTAVSEAPGAPTNPVIGLSPRAYDVHLSWTAPADPDGDPVTNYIVQVRNSETPEADGSDYENVHSGTSIDNSTMYNFGGHDIDNKDGIDLPARNMIPDGGVSVDIRIRAVNNFNRNADPPVADAAWLNLASVPVGHEGAPKRPETPRVRPDVTTTTTYEGRSGLNVTWNTAEFIDDGMPGLTVDDPATPADERALDQTVFNDAVTYILVVDGDELTTGAITHAAALAAGGNDARPGYDDDMLQTETEKTYYVYALNSEATLQVTDASVRSFPSRTGTGKTARPLRPDAPTGLDVQDSGHTEIDVSWTHASDSDTENQCAPARGSDADGSECGESVITGYKIEISETGTSGWTVLEDEYETQSYTAVNLNPATRYFFRVSALNSRYTSDPTSAMSAETTDPGAPTPPGGLVAQADGQDSIKLCWYEQNVVIGGANMDEALPVLGYKITRQAAGGSVETVMENTGNDKTEFTDTGLMAGTAYTYRVHSINLGGTSTGATATATTDPAMLPGAPTGVTANATSATEITVSWTAPADNGGADITGYIIERRYTGDMMMDIPSDGYNTAAMGASFAFSNHMEWWETLNCKGMLAAAGSDETMVETPAAGSDQAMYCAHYADTEPTNMAGTITAGSDVDMKIKALFEKRYEVLTGTATSHMDTMLMADTKYTYRVSAVNAKGRSMWSDAAMATTGSGNADPMPATDPADQLPTMVSLIVGGDSREITLTDSFTDSDEGDTLTYSAVSSAPAKATATVSDDNTMLTIAPVAAGEATVTVTADDSNGGTATHDIAVTVMPERMAPANVVVNPVGSGLVNVEWTPVPGAHGYWIVAAEAVVGGSVHSEAINGGDSTLGSIGGLTPGVEYLIYVGAFFTLDDYVLDYQETITAE